MFTNLTSSTTSSLAQTLSIVPTTNFIEANNFNNSAITFPFSSVVQEEDEDEEENAEEDKEEAVILPSSQVQPSTSSAV